MPTSLRPLAQLNGIQQGVGCVYPPAVTTLADQLDSDGLNWKGYQEDMGNDPARDGSVTCSHPPLGISDPTTSAEAADGYTTRHDPFMYFHSIIDNTSECNQNVVPLGDTNGTMPAGTPAGATGLVTDLQSVATTPNFSFITPNLCDDGHDFPCTNTTGAGQGGGSAVGDIDKWLKTWVPIITSSPAFQQDGLLEITFDEAEDPTSTPLPAAARPRGRPPQPAKTASLGPEVGWSGRSCCLPSSRREHGGDQDLLQPLLLPGVARGPVRASPTGRGPDGHHHLRQAHLHRLGRPGAGIRRQAIELTSC